MKNQTIFHYEGSNLGITDSFKSDGQTQGIKLLSFKVVPANEEMQQDLFWKRAILCMKSSAYDYSMIIRL